MERIGFKVGVLYGWWCALTIMALNNFVPLLNSFIVSVLKYKVDLNMKFKYITMCYYVSHSIESLLTSFITNSIRYLQCLTQLIIAYVIAVLTQCLVF